MILLAVGAHSYCTIENKEHGSGLVLEVDIVVIRTKYSSGYPDSRKRFNRPNSFLHSLADILIDRHFTCAKLPSTISYHVQGLQTYKSPDRTFTPVTRAETYTSTRSEADPRRISSLHQLTDRSLLALLIG